MIIRILKEIDREELVEFLEAHMETSMFILNNITEYGIEQSDALLSGIYLGAFDENYGLQAVLVQFNSGVLMMQASNHDDLYDLIHIFSEIGLKPVRGVIGETNQATIVCEGLNLPMLDASGSKDEVLQSLDLKCLIPSPKSGEQEIVSVRSISEELLFNWISAYRVEALQAGNDEQAKQNVIDQTSRMRAKDNCSVLLHNDVPVGLAGFNASYKDIVQIGPVWTPPEYRGQKFARILLSEMLEQALAQGMTRSILFSDNPSALKLYRALGYQDIGKFSLLFF